MAYSREQIIEDLKGHIEKSSVQHWNRWYVGVTKDARNRLFSEHGVREKGDWWIFRAAESSEIAREIEAYFVRDLGTDGGRGGGDITADTVYAYKKTPHTDP